MMRKSCDRLIVPISETLSPFATIFFCMKKLPEHVDFIVVGAGVAGLRAAITLADAGQVLVLAKQELTESNTQYAQGGIAVALSDEDEISLHLQDTIQAGDGIVNAEAAHVLVEEGPQRIQELIEWGTQFDRHGTKLTFTREAAHSRSRVLHAHGDSTGREIGRALHARAATLKNILFCEFEFTSALHVDSGRIRGVELISPEGAHHIVHSSAILLATGGGGHVYSNTTNPPVATADGVAMAYRAGAEISDMEFVQFHPTALYVKNAPRFLLSEALRGEGGILRNSELTRFMSKYHELGELAPRDVVARAIAHELELSRMKDPVVYLDLTHLKDTHIKSRFPRIHETCLKYNVDITVDPVPIRPAAHYMMGGVRTDLNGATNLPGLYAAGEAACTGVHGANRLASNSLLEGLVFGARAADAMREQSSSKANPRFTVSGPARRPATNPNVEPLISEIQQLMWNQVGIVRTRHGLAEALQKLQALAERLPAPDSRRHCEARNIHTAGLLITRSALARLESRGAHYRLDCPEHDDAKFKKHSIVTGTNVRFM
ncbi:MAG TPA: L-aspartate oxidase [Candidatus Acidoferrales bacterium]|jgi:L-aspartate oxidase|nr:L-aspartate oxidase [Candidatus Acidoferrales bacterium]